MITLAWALRAALAGLGAGLAIMAGLAARAAYAVTVGHRWRELRKL